MSRLVKNKTLKRRVGKLLQKSLWSATDEESTPLLPVKESVTVLETVKDTETRSQSETNQKNKKNKSKRFLKRLGKWTMTACRYIGMGAQTMSAPGLAPHSFVTYSTSSFYQRPHHAFDGPNDDYIYYLYNGCY